MEACLILLGVLIVAGIVLRLTHRPSEDSKVKTSEDLDDGCCGTHEICEKINQRNLSPVEYYDDEELDRHAGKAPDGYTPEEVDEFREVLYTLLPSDVAGWGTSLQKRNITLPDVLRDEFIIMLNDINNSR